MTSETTRLLFDECIGRPHIERLRDFVNSCGGPSIEIVHVLELQAAGERDEEWIPRIADERWIIVTQDGGKGGRKKGEPLPKLCRELGITYVLLGPAVGQRKSFEKAVTILGILPEILDVAAAPRGTRLLVVPLAANDSRERMRGRVEKTFTPPPPGQLFDPKTVQRLP